MPSFIRELHETYGRTMLFDTVAADAGNTSQGVATALHDLAYGYILAIKQNHGEIYLEAQRTLSRGTARQEITKREHGALVTYRIYRHRLDGGYLTWKHARQLVRIERIVEGNDKRSEGNRYFVSNLPWNRLNDLQWLKAIRAYWRCENNSNWTADVFWREDAKRTPWTTNAEAIYALAALRMLAINIVAVMRAMVLHPAYPPGKLPWKLAIRRMLVELSAQVETEPDASPTRV